MKILKIPPHGDCQSTHIRTIEKIEFNIELNPSIRKNPNSGVNTARGIIIVLFIMIVISALLSVTGVSPYVFGSFLMVQVNAFRTLLGL